MEFMMFLKQQWEKIQTQDVSISLIVIMSYTKKSLKKGNLKMA